VAVSRGATRIVSVDCDPDAIYNTEENVAQSPFASLFSIRTGSLFDSIEETFDVIAANWPISGSCWSHLDQGVKTLSEQFFEKLPKHLAESGICFFAFASFGNIEGLEYLLARQPLEVKILSRPAFDVNWYILTISNT